VKTWNAVGLKARFRDNRLSGFQVPTFPTAVLFQPVAPTASRVRVRALGPGGAPFGARFGKSSVAMRLTR
jgi:hypothetical protein